MRMMKNRDLPFVNIENVAYQKMMCYTNSVKTEIGWLGTASKVDKNEYIIHDVFLLEQEVHGATAELTTDGISKLLYDELSTRKDYDFILSNMKVWGHSHNSMPTFPSQQDEMQMEVFEDGGYNFVIRLITNHAGDIRVDVYDYESGIIYEELDWDVNYTPEQRSNIASVKKQLEYYNQLLDRVLNKSHIDEEAILKEVKEKVKEKRYDWAKNANHFKGCKVVKDYGWLDDDEDDYVYNPYKAIDRYIDYDGALEDGVVDINEEGEIRWYK